MKSIKAQSYLRFNSEYIPVNPRVNLWIKLLDFVDFAVQAALHS